MNSAERQQVWQRELNKHANNPCQYCDNDQRCDVFDNLIAAYNGADDITPEMLTIEERVANGARLLDEKKPEWFHYRFSGMDISSGSSCVLAILYGYYGNGLDVVFADEAWDSNAAYLHGFNLLREEWRKYDKGNYSVVDPYKAAWMAEVNKRMEALSAECANKI